MASPANPADRPASRPNSARERLSASACRAISTKRRTRTPRPPPLVVEDEPLVRLFVTEALGDLGYTTLEAENAQDGLEILRSSARIDLLVSDVGLPNGMNGRQLADAARELRPGLKVLFITGYAENALLSQGHLADGMQVMTKPFTMEDLAGRLRDSLGEG
jgi:CheY-like chemotaxis protein